MACSLKTSAGTTLPPHVNRLGPLASETAGLTSAALPHPLRPTGLG